MPLRPSTADPPTPDAVVLGGPRVIDRYQIVAVIGRGAGGAVYRAIDLRLGKTVAVKTATGSRDGARLTDRVRQRFLREARALSRVDQRNVVQVLDYGFADDGTPFLVMEHLRGRDLGAALALASGPLPVEEVADIGLGVCAALRACHRVGIIHRDLKAANVFLVETDTGIDIKVLDFGVSKAAAADDRTREAQLCAASHHLAPEQIDGKVGPASDQYALGVLLYFCLTRQFPHPVRGGRASAGIPALPPAMDTILRRATRVAPLERFESVYALGRELLQFASQRGQAQWRPYYQPAAHPHAGWSSAPANHAPAAAGPAARTTSVDVARAVTATKVARRAGRDAGAGGGAEGGAPRSAGPWLSRAASIGCVALAASGLASGRRRPPRPAPAASARRSAPVQAAVLPPREPAVVVRAHRPSVEPPILRPDPEPRAARSTIAVVEPSAVSFPLQEAGADPPANGRRSRPHAQVPVPAEPAPPPALPTLDPAGIGIPTE